MKRFFLILLLMMLPLLSWGYTSHLASANQAFHFTAGIENNNTLNFHWQIDSESYLYKDHIHFKLLSPQSATLTTIKLPQAKHVNNEVFGNYQVYTGSLTIPVSVTKTQGKPVKLKVTYQGCSKAGICYPPVSHVVTVNFSDRQLKIDSSLALTKKSEQFQIAQLLQHTSFWLILMMFLGFGLLLSFTPCVLPMIPILSGIIVGQKQRVSTRQAFVLSLVYVLAMSLTYAVAGVIVGLLGSNIQAAMQTPWVLILFSLLFIALAFSLFGLYELQLPEKLRDQLIKVTGEQRGGTYLGAASMGILATLVVSPCVTPPLIGALIFIAQTGNYLLGGLALFALGIGMGIPLLVIGTLGGKFLPRSGGWMQGVKQFFGFLMLGMALYLLSRILSEPTVIFLSGVLLVIAGIFLGEFWLRGSKKRFRRLRRGIAIILLVYGVLLIIGGAKGHSDFWKPLANSAQVNASESVGEVNFIPVNNLKQLNQALAKAKEEQKPVLLDFYADWCLACKEMDATTFKNKQVQKALKHFVVLRANVTSNNTDDKALAQRYGVVAPPSFVFFDKQGQWLPNQQVVGSMGAQKMTKQLRSVLTQSN